MHRWHDEGDGVYLCTDHGIRVRFDGADWQLHLSSLTPAWRTLQIPASVLRHGRDAVLCFVLAILDRYDAENAPTVAEAANA